MQSHPVCRADDGRRRARCSSSPARASSRARRTRSSLAIAIRDIAAPRRRAVHLQGVVRQGEPHVGTSFRGPGSTRACACSRACANAPGVPILTDIHEPAQAAPVAEVADVLQIPAFLSRQTDLHRRGRADRTGRQHQEGPVPRAARHAARDREGHGAGNPRVIVTERGFTFGYNNLVVDMRAFPMMRGSATRSSSTSPTACSCPAAATA